MKTTIEDVGPWRKAIAITLEAEEVEKEMDRAIARFRQKAAMPGFRKGKVPTDLVRQVYRENLESEVLNQILPDATEKAVQEHALELAAPPRIQDLHFRPGEPLTFRAMVDVWPRIDVGGFKEIELDETLNEVDEALVEEFLEALRERVADYEPVPRSSQPGDYVDATLVAVDLNGQKLPRAKRQDVRMEAGRDTLLPEFREASLGAEAGAIRVLHVHYPEDFSDPELAGRQRHYRMQVRQILEKKLPGLDDALAGKVDGSSNLDELKSKIRLRLEAEERLRARRRTEEALVDRLIAANPFDLPDSIVERSLSGALERARKESPGLDEEAFRAEYRPLVERLRRREILLDSLARQESIEVTEEELDEALAGSSRGVDPAVVRRRLEREDRLDEVRGELRETKILAFLREAATIHRVVQPRERKSNIILP